MASKYRVIDTIHDPDGGDPLEVGVHLDKVVISMTDAAGDVSGAVRLDTAGRDQFAKAWAEAERQAEAWDAKQVRECGRCDRVLVDQDDAGWYYQTPVTSPEAPGLTFMDRVHECDGKPHDVRIRGEVSDA